MVHYTGQHDRPVFEAWLCGHLHGEHDATLREPLPDEMLRLIDALPEHR